MKARKLLRYLAGFVALAAMADSCAPVITVKNDTTVVVRAIVRTVAGAQTLAPSPGNSSATEAQEGPYSVTVIPDEEWKSYARLVRKDLNEQLANAKGLSGDKLIQLINRLKDVADKMKAFEDAGIGASCSGNITQDGGGTATVTTLPGGKIVVSCR